MQASGSSKSTSPGSCVLRTTLMCWALRCPSHPHPFTQLSLDLGGAVLSALAAMCCAPFLADYNGTWHLGTKQREAYVYSMMNIPLNLHTKRCGPVGSCTQLWPVWLGLRTSPACQLPLALADPLHVV